MNWRDLVTIVLMSGGMLFFVAGTVGLFRFPDLYCRLHALTKADNVGLGLTILALMVRAAGWTDVAKLGLIWLLVMAASTTVCFLVGREAQRRGIEPWRGEGAT
jgi:multicomponent Na+:H+ antiporter subunit G